MTFRIATRKGTQFAMGAVDRIYGVSGLGFFRVTLDVRLQVEPGDPGCRLLSLSADLLAGGRLVTRLDASPQSLPVEQYASSSPATVVLQADLDRARVEAVETLRNGGHLELNLNVFACLQEPDGNMARQSVQEHYPVNQGVWVEVLQQMEYQKTMLLEVPIPDEQTAPELAHAVDFLGQAQQAMVRGHYRDAVGLCRQVLEEMSNGLGDANGVRLQEIFGKTRDMDKAERLRILREALKVLTHPAHHRDEVTALIEWNRVDAASVITIAAALLTDVMAPDGRRA
jgi:hypothetical protein